MIGIPRCAPDAPRCMPMARKRKKNHSSSTIVHQNGLPIPQTHRISVLCCIILVRVQAFATVRVMAPRKQLSTALPASENEHHDDEAEEVILDIQKHMNNKSYSSQSGGLIRGEQEDKLSNVSTQLTAFARDLRRLSIVRPAVPNADFSAPLELISAGSSYTRIWNPDTWKRHSLSYPHERYYRHLSRWRYSTTAHRVLPAAMLSAAWALFVSIIVRASPGNMLVKATKGASAALGPLSAPIALLLTLRTNAALGRLNEARQAWGRLILYTRSYTALLRTYMLPLYPEAAILSARHLSIIGWLLKSTVRGEDDAKQLEVIKTMLGDNNRDYEWLSSHPKPVWAVAIRLRQIVAAVALSYPESFLVAHNLFEEGIANFEGVVGVNERLLASPIPPTYSRHLSRVLSIWLAMLPIGLIGSGIPVLGVIISCAFTSYVLVGLGTCTH